jgi:hypothetical protein
VDGYVNRAAGGWTELRVHGVSGTPPVSMLGHPHVARVTGDEQAGFYRRWWESQSGSADTTERRIEAYSWGGLTAGSGQRALWLLLTPFLLVNVAFWARPALGRNPRRFVKPVRRLGEAIQRLFALSITLTLMLGVVAASMDFVGWQCVRPTASSCANRVSWLRFLSWNWFALPGRRLAVTAAVPLAVVGLLWWLANKTWQETEAVRVPAAESEDDQVTPLENRRLWNGTGPVRRLRAVHVSAAFALVGVFVLSPFARHFSGLRAVWHREPARWPATAVELLFAAALTLLAVSVLLVCLPRMTDRLEARRVEERTEHTDVYTFLPLLALLIDVAAVVMLCLSTIGRPDPTPGSPRSPLPWLAGAVQIVTAAQGAMLLVMVVVVVILLAGRRRPGSPAAVPAAPARPDATTPASGSTVAEPDGSAPGAARAGHPVEAPPAWFGFANPVLMMLGAALAGAYAAGLVLAVAHAIGKPQPVDRGLDPFVAAMPYFWAAALSVPVAALALLLVVVMVIVIRLRAGKSMLAEVERAYPRIKIREAVSAAHDPVQQPIARRARAISHAWARAAVSDAGRAVTGLFVVGLATLMVIAAVGYVQDSDWIYVHLPWMVNVGDLLVGLFVLGLLYVGRQAYRNPQFRRSVGVLWDLGTFWPRATHPLAPPCYAERAVPDLINRIHYLGCEQGGRVLLSCHSQGTVIGAAVVMQLTYAESERVALVTYGSPLRRLYARFFPAFFGPDALLRAGAFLLGKPVVTTDDARERWPWRNLHRPSDPIGGAVISAYPATEISEDDWAGNPQFGDNNDVDRRLVDPLFGKSSGDSSYPQTFGHSYYPDDRAYRAAVAKVEELRLRASATPGS